MLRTPAVLVLLLLLASTAAAQGKSKPWLRGAWEGTGYQTDDNSTWPMRLTITKRKGRRTFSIDYPSLSCGGRWQLLSITQGKARFRERLDHGQDKCTNNGRVVVERIGRGQLIFLYSNQGSREITASAVLNRRRPSSNHQ
jgi:hypothetical protein